MSPQSSLSETSVSLKPSPRLALLITALGIGLFALPIPPWPSACVSGFGLFLLIQTYTLKIEFTKNDLVVWQLNKEIRRFPFEKWLAWRIFFPEMPGILYFREEASPHLLPVLFDPSTLQEQLRLRVGTLERPKTTPLTTS